MQGRSSWSKKINYTWEITILCGIWGFGEFGNFLKNRYVVNNCLSSNLRILLHTYNSYNRDYLTHINFSVCQIEFLLKSGFPSQFCVFNAKLPSVTQRLVSQENA